VGKPKADSGQGSRGEVTAEMGGLAKGVGGRKEQDHGTTGNKNQDEGGEGKRKRE